MTRLQILVLAGLSVYAIYKQTHLQQVPPGPARFKLPLIYAGIGIGVGGFGIPAGVTAVAVMAFGVVLSVVVGLARGRLTHVWLADDGTPTSRGSATDVGLFLGMVAVTFSIGFYTAAHGIKTGNGFGEVLVMIAIMLAVQSELIRRRVTALSHSVQQIEIAI